jgi:hypothetical protein
LAGAIAAGVLPPGRAATDSGRSGEVAKAPEVPAIPIPAFLEKGIDWLVAAQHEDGGWGAGSHAHQDVRDPRAVQSDPATTAFVGLALLRVGNTPTSGTHAARVVRATEYLTKAVEDSSDGPRVTELQGTQPQTKLGPLVDTALTVQFLSRAVPLLPKGVLADRANAALDKALGKLHGAQGKDGEWGKGGWANALQGALGTVALETAASAGKPMPGGALEAARKAQQTRVDVVSGRAKTDDSAGVELYSMAGAARNAAAQSALAERIVDAAKARGELPKDAEVNEESLRRAGMSDPADAKPLADAVAVMKAQSSRLEDPQLLAGFGNNGGEEFLSYMMTSEALVIRGGDDWPKWRTKLQGLLEKVQSADGSWTGHHCITSPVFCTAAVVAAFTADHDAAALRARDAQATDSTTGTKAR